MPTFKETDDFIVDLRGRGEQRNKQTNDEGFRNPVGFRKPDSQGSWLHFIQYNNAFLIILVACVLAFGSLSFASEEVRDATIGGKTVYAEGTDNTLLLEQDFDKFNMDFKITGIVEDEESYAVQYSYVDFDLTSPLPVPPLIRGGSEGGVVSTGSEGVAWQFVEKQGARKIDKPFRQDLGLYLAGQLRQEASARIKELKRLQREEREKGLTKIVQVTEYSGLIGKILDLSTAVFPGYEPVKKVELETPLADEQIVRRAQTGGADNLANIYNNYVEDHPAEIVKLNSGDNNATTTASGAETVGSSTPSLEEGTLNNTAEEAGNAASDEEVSSTPVADVSDSQADTDVAQPF
ncbi:hypothetical protein A2477_03575 [Candidatus Falkowbacteria bacterium RIFOXYC2_FULL_47_12]|uniref:Uncharacterized protein n=2 Tax=Candidatus Falkowiibacteriota TaxID=1752728 RepID=A0A1F5TQN7_9BACT|nr:MAG: hypothetical protein A2242_02790 [Candidatus Falkowbacteria bacterium RIFOXYA2_FULL_47_9]OGF40841.1 MAG: hypothetical protein A2477_03575 [Candidatus Falkowbacteria bacterium RIFOXYC2_FULL_47_12]